MRVQSLWAALPRILLGAAVIAYAVYFSYLTLTRYAAFEARALDLGNLNQAVWNTAHGDWYRQTNQPGVDNRLGLHVEPILIPISWLYWLHPGPEILLILQATVVALGALPVFALGKRLLRNEWLALLFALAFLLSPAIQGANWLEFHPVTLAPTFLAAAFYFLAVGRVAWFILFAVLAASCKEDMGLLIFMMGLYAGLVLKRWRWAIPTMALGIGWSLFAVLVIQNSLGGNYHWGRYAYLGETPGEIVVALLTRPDLIFGQLAAANVAGYLGQLTLPTAFLALLAPEVLLLALPSLAVNLLADFPPMHQVDTLIYAAPIAPFVILAGVVGAARVLRQAENAHQPRARTMAAVLIALGVLAALIVDQRLHGYLPGGGNYILYEITPHHRRAAAIIAQIHPDDALSSQDKLNPHVSGRRTSYIFPRVFDTQTGNANAVFLDVTGPAWPQHPNDLHTTVQELLAGDFGIAAAEDGYLLLRAGEKNRTLPDAFYTPWRMAEVAPTYTQTAAFGDALTLVGYDVVNDAHGEVMVKLYWQTQQALAENLRFYVAFLDSNGALLHDSEFYPPVATLWYPTSQWRPGEIVEMTTLPWTLNADRFTLALAVHTDNNPRHSRLPVSSETPASTVLEQGTLLRLGGFERSKNGWRPQPNNIAPPQKALNVRLGDAIALTGTTIALFPQEGRSLPITLYWQALAQPDRDLTAFVHVLDGNGEKAAQLDWTPHDALGPRPTSTWRAGQSIVDVQTIELPDALPSGEYRLIAGLYDSVSGKRAHTSGADAGAGDVAELGTLIIR